MLRYSSYSARRASDRLQVALPCALAVVLAGWGRAQTAMTRKSMLPPRAVDVISEAEQESQTKYLKLLLGDRPAYYLINPRLRQGEELKKLLARGQAKGEGKLAASQVKALATRESATNRFVQTFDKVVREFLSLFYPGKTEDAKNLQALIRDERYTGSSGNVVIFCFDATCAVLGESTLRVRLNLRVVRLRLVKEGLTKRVDRAELVFSDAAVGLANTGSSNIEDVVHEAMVRALQLKIAVSLWANRRMQRNWIAANETKAGLQRPSIQDRLKRDLR